EEKVSGSAQGDPLLSELDEEIMTFISKQGHVTAGQVQKKFKYKGTNAASARLNALFRQGLLEKKQVGRKVIFVSR
ncbi:MAG: BlaI/MecI/CopY family transcriptional regulator, partial [Candidatus Micrarchaeota archaeon]